MVKRMMAWMLVVGFAAVGVAGCSGSSEPPANTPAKKEGAGPAKKAETPKRPAVDVEGE